MEEGVLSKRRAFLGLDYVDTEQEATSFLERHAITYPIGPDVGMRWAQEFDVKEIPETYILDKEGKLSYVKRGSFRTVDEIMEILSPLLAR